MTDEAGGSSGPFDLARITTLIELMEQHGLSEVSLRRGDEEWQIKRGIPDVAQWLSSLPSPGAVAAAPPSVAPTADSSQTSATSDTASKADEAIFIKSPTVGTFYAAPSPDDPPFVQPGTVVSPDTVVCIVEAMKVFNQIPAEVAGTIAEVLVKSGDPVEYGQPLFRVSVG